MKSVIRNIFMGSAWGLSFLVLFEIILSFANGGIFIISSNEAIKQAVCSIIAGNGFCIPTLIYKNQKVSYIIKVVIHMGIGFSVYFSIALWAGWITINNSLEMTIITIICMVIAAIVIWFGFYIYNIYEAKKINERLKKLKVDNK